MAPIADQIPADRNPAELLALAVLEFGRLVGAQSGDTMAPYRAAAASVRTTAGLMGSTSKVSGSTAPSTLDSNLTLVEQLERLRSLQQSGVLTHEEFESAKRRLLKG
jgi:hypothetical protein